MRTIITDEYKTENTIGGVLKIKMGFKKWIFSKRRKLRFKPRRPKTKSGILTYHKIK